MDPNAPPPWLMFLIMCVLITGFLGLLFVISWLKRTFSGEASVTRVRAARSAGVQRTFKRSHVLNRRSPQQNAEKANVQRSGVPVQRSEKPLAPPVISPDLPTSVTELQQLAEAIRLRATGDVTSKQAALERAFQCSKGQGETWKRASKLWDLAMPTPPPAALAPPSTPAVALTHEPQTA